MVAPMGHYTGDRILHPIGYTVRAQIVQKKHLCIQRHTVRLLIGGIGIGIVARPDAVKEGLVIGENTLEPLLNDPPERRDGEVSLPGPGLAY
jgi:hypothetical protein